MLTLLPRNFDEWISTVGNPDHQNIRVYQNGTFFSNDSGLNDYTWSHWKGCHTKFIQMFNDPTLEPYLHKTNNCTSNKYANWISDGRWCINKCILRYAVYFQFLQNE